MVLLMILHAVEEVFKGLNFTWDCESTTLVKPKFLSSLFQQQLEKRVAKVAGGNDESPQFWPNIDSQVPFWNIMWWLRTVAAAIFIRITVHKIG